MDKKIVKTYDYLNADGDIVSQTIRFEPKGFCQRRPVNGRYAWSLTAGWYHQRPPHDDYYLIKDASSNPDQVPAANAIWLEAVELVPYRLPEVAEAIKKGTPILICEGEKDADTIYNMGYAATTCPMGAGKWRKSYTESLKGCQSAIIIVDKDEPGRNHAESVAREIAASGTNIKILEMPDRNSVSVKDFSDWRDAGGTKEELEQLIANTPSWVPGEDNAFEQLIMQYGQPYYLNSKTDMVTGINEAFWAGLHYKENIELFEPVERSFYRYNNETGLYDEVSEHLIKQEVSSRILEVSRQLGHNSLERQRKNSILNSITSQLKGVAEKRDAFLKQSNFVHLGNGVVRFTESDTADFVKFSPDFYSRNQSPIHFIPDAKCNRFMNELLLPAVNEEDAVIIQKYVGQCLLGNNSIQRVLILDGAPARGKTTLSNIVQRLVGMNNVTELRTRHLDDRFELYRYLKRTLLVGVDVPGRFLSERGSHVIKGLVGGDWFDAEQKCGTGNFQLRGNYCIVITSNSRLQVKLDGDLGAWRRRLLIVRFEAPPPPKKIPDFADHLIDTEGSGILNWALQGLALLLDDIQKYGDIYLGDRQQAIVDALLAESDSIRHFLNDCVIKDDDADLSVHEIIEYYAEYCPTKGWNAKPITIIQRELESLMLELFSTSKAHSIKRDGRYVKGFRRVRLKTQGATR